MNTAIGALIALVSLALSSTIPTMSLSLGQADTTDKSIVVMDGTTNPANVSSAITTTPATTFVRVKVPAQTAVYRLIPPAGAEQPEVDAASINYNVTFRDVAISVGNWTVKTTLGATVTQFRVIEYTNSFENITSDQVVIVASVPPCTATNCWGPYYTQSMDFKSETNPQCTVGGGASPDATVYPASGSRNRVEYRSNVTADVILGETAQFVHYSQHFAAPVLEQGEYWLRESYTRLIPGPLQVSFELTSRTYFRMSAPPFIVSEDVWGNCSDTLTETVDTAKFRFTAAYS